MTKNEFRSLSLSAALGFIWDALRSPDAEGFMLAYEAPKPALSPKYDTRVRAKGGLVYASECDLSQLQYYLNRAQRPTEDKYMEKQQKEAKALGFFLRWRAENPDARWRGERYQQGQVTAAAPARGLVSATGTIRRQRLTRCLLVAKWITDRMIRYHSPLT